MKKRGHVIIAGDPYHDPNLTLLREDWSIAVKGSDITVFAVLVIFTIFYKLG